MKYLFCERCGANELRKDNEYMVCDFCGSKFIITIEDLDVKTSNISLGNDIKKLLEKCRTDPRNAKRYANLILDIDPFNEDALKYI